MVRRVIRIIPIFYVDEKNVKKPSQFFKRYSMLDLNGLFRVFDGDGCGKLYELYIRSQDDFHLQIVIDNIVVIDNNLSELVDGGDYTENYDCYQTSDNKYVFVHREVEFNRNLSIAVYGNTVLEEMWCKGVIYEG